MGGGQSGSQDARLRVAEHCFALSVGNLVSYLFPLSRFPRLQEDGLPTENGL
jgi:hypothetical protein